MSSFRIESGRNYMLSSSRQKSTYPTLNLNTVHAKKQLNSKTTRHLFGINNGWSAPTYSLPKFTTFRAQMRTNFEFSPRIIVPKAQRKMTESSGIVFQFRVALSPREFHSFINLHSSKPFANVHLHKSIHNSFIFPQNS